MAGGTGLSAILAIAEQLVRDSVPRPDPHCTTA